MNKEELLNEIEKTKQHLTNLEKMLKEHKDERWKPKDGEIWFYLNTYLEAVEDYFLSSSETARLNYKNYNCFPTREQAELEAEKILVRRQLEDIARRLNKGEEIDWSDEGQTKYFIFFDCKTQLIERDGNLRNKIQGVVYCLDNNFRKIAIQEIGEERLKKYLKGEEWQIKR